MSGEPLQLILTGVSHHTAPLEVRERLAPCPGVTDAVYAAAGGPDLRELVVISTCNRIEFCAVATPAGADALVRAYCEAQGIPAGAFLPVCFRHTGLEAVRHLFEVASGIDSQIVGEPEILGQVKDAYQAAAARGTAGALLNRLFQKTFQSAKCVRSETAIGQGRVGVASVAVDLAGKIYGRLESVRILNIGAGEIGGKTVRALQSRGARDITVASRTIERSMGMASSVDGRAIPFEHVTRHLGDYDIIICSTGAPGFILSAAEVARAMHARPVRPLFLIDLSLPRNVEPRAGDIENVFVYNLDDLGKIAAENLACREAETARCREILRARAEALWGGLESRLRAAPAPG